MKVKIMRRDLVLAVVVLVPGMIFGLHAGAASTDINYKTVEVNGLDIFYREAGDTNAPTLLLLHGFPTSSHMFRNLMAELSDSYYLLAPDFPGFGNSSQPSMDDFDYTFDNLAATVEGFLDALGVTRYSIYLMDYGAPWVQDCCKTPRARRNPHHPKRERLR